MRAVPGGDLRLQVGGQAVGLFLQAGAWAGSEGGGLQVRRKAVQGGVREGPVPARRARWVQPVGSMHRAGALTPLFNCMLGWKAQAPTINWAAQECLQMCRMYPCVRLPCTWGAPWKHGVVFLPFSAHAASSPPRDPPTARERLPPPVCLGPTFA